MSKTQQNGDKPLTGAAKAAAERAAAKAKETEDAKATEETTGEAEAAGAGAEAAGEQIPEPPPRPLAKNSREEIASLTPDEARTRLVREGVHITPDVRKMLTDRAASQDLSTREPRPTPPSPFGGHTAPTLTPVEAAALEGDDLVMCVFPRPVRFTLPGHKRVMFGMGTQPVPRRFVEPVMDDYLLANGVKRA